MRPLKSLPGGERRPDVPARHLRQHAVMTLGKTTADAFIDACRTAGVEPKAPPRVHEWQRTQHLSHAPFALHRTWLHTPSRILVASEVQVVSAHPLKVCYMLTITTFGGAPLSAADLLWAQAQFGMEQATRLERDGPAMFVLMV